MQFNFEKTSSHIYVDGDVYRDVQKSV